MSITIAATLLALIMLSAGCATSEPTIQQGPDAAVSFDGLHEVDNVQADIAWAKPDFDISSYNKIMLAGAGIEYTPGGNNARLATDRNKGGPYVMDDKTRAKFEALVGDTFREEMSNIENFEIVDEPGPDVMTVWAGLLDVTSYAPPDNLPGRAEVFISRIGEATLVLELRDSETNTILARSVDRRAAETQFGMLMNSNSVSNATEVRWLIRFWARRLREGLDGFVE